MSPASKRAVRWTTPCVSAPRRSQPAQSPMLRSGGQSAANHVGVPAETFFMHSTLAHHSGTSSPMNTRSGRRARGLGGRLPRRQAEGGAFAAVLL
jgi:hypothetical protein